MTAQLNSILNEFSPLERRSLLSWVASSTSVGKLPQHVAYRKCLSEIAGPRCRVPLNRKTKIRFTLMREFQSQLSQAAIDTVLVDAVEAHLNRP